MVALINTRCKRRLVNAGEPRGRGGRDMTSGSTGSTPRDCAGGPSIMMSNDVSYFHQIIIVNLLIHNICIAFSGLSNPKHVQMNTKLKAAALVLSWKVRKF